MPRGTVGRPITLTKGVAGEIRGRDDHVRVHLGPTLHLGTSSPCGGHGWAGMAVTHRVQANAAIDLGKAAIGVEKAVIRRGKQRLGRAPAPGARRRRAGCRRCIDRAILTPRELHSPIDVRPARPRNRRGRARLDRRMVDLAQDGRRGRGEGKRRGDDGRPRGRLPGRAPASPRSAVGRRPFGRPSRDRRGRRAPRREARARDRLGLCRRERARPRLARVVRAAAPYDSCRRPVRRLAHRAGRGRGRRSLRADGRGARPTPPRRARRGRPRGCRLVVLSERDRPGRRRHLAPRRWRVAHGARRPRRRHPVRRPGRGARPRDVGARRRLGRPDDDRRARALHGARPRPRSQRRHRLRAWEVRSDEPRRRRAAGGRVRVRVGRRPPRLEGARRRRRLGRRRRRSDPRRTRQRGRRPPRLHHAHDDRGGRLVLGPLRTRVRPMDRHGAGVPRTRRLAPEPRSVTPRRVEARARAPRDGARRAGRRRVPRRRHPRLHAAELPRSGREHGDGPGRALRHRRAPRRAALVRGARRRARDA